MSLADELLADLEEDGPVIESYEDEEDEENDMIEDVDDVENINMETSDANNGVRGVAKLRDSFEVCFHLMISSIILLLRFVL